jgi:ABC-type nitrate/sulfonate/bicarbonate transport system substrate-binding protein
MATITVALDWAVNPNHIGLVLAQQRRYFAAEGVDVAVVPAEAARGPVTMVHEGATDLAYAFAGTVILARAAGEPLLSVAAVGQRHLSSLAVLAQSGIARPADLAGKRYASFGHPALERAVITAMMRHDGATDTAFDLSVTRFASLEGLVSGDFDCLWIYDAIEGIEAQTDGIALTTFAPGDYGIPNYYAPVLFAEEALLADPAKFDAARRALVAMRRGYLDAIADPDAVFDHLNANVLPIGDWPFTNPDATRLSLRALSQGWRADDWGRQRLDDWQGFARFLWQHGALGAIPEPDYASYFTNRLLD